MDQRAFAEIKDAVKKRNEIYLKILDETNPEEKKNLNTKYRSIKITIDRIKKKDPTVYGGIKHPRLDSIEDQEAVKTGRFGILGIKQETQESTETQETQESTETQETQESTETQETQESPESPEIQYPETPEKQSSSSSSSRGFTDGVLNPDITEESYSATLPYWQTQHIVQGSPPELFSFTPTGPSRLREEDFKNVNRMVGVNQPDEFELDTRVAQITSESDFRNAYLEIAEQYASQVGLSGDFINGFKNNNILGMRKMVEKMIEGNPALKELLPSLEQVANLSEYISVGVRNQVADKISSFIPAGAGSQIDRYVEDFKEITSSLPDLNFDNMIPAVRNRLISVVRNIAGTANESEYINVIASPIRNTFSQIVQQIKNMPSPPTMPIRLFGDSGDSDDSDIRDRMIESRRIADSLGLIDEKEEKEREEKHESRASIFGSGRREEKSSIFGSGGPVASSGAQISNEDLIELLKSINPALSVKKPSEEEKRPYLRFAGPSERGNAVKLVQNSINSYLEDVNIFGETDASSDFLNEI